MYSESQSGSDDESQWLSSLEAGDDVLDLSSAVSINDPISKFGLKPPLVVEVGTSLKNALVLLQKEEKNCLLVLEDEKLVGILTERDILLKVTGKGYDLSIVTVDEFMTGSPEYLSKEDPLAYALNKMHVGGFRHVPIIDDSRKPVGLISISDIISTIADYFSREIINLPPLNKIVDSEMREGG
jgi:CBS domain-containing protein